MEQRTAAAPRSLSLVIAHKTPSLMELTWDRSSPTQLNCILETGGLSNAGLDRSSERRRRGRSDPSEGYAS
jgi:hypothetical protein